MLVSISLCQPAIAVTSSNREEQNFISRSIISSVSDNEHIEKRSIASLLLLLLRFLLNFNSYAHSHIFELSTVLHSDDDDDDVRSTLMERDYSTGASVLVFVFGSFEIENISTHLKENDDNQQTGNERKDGRDDSNPQFVCIHRVL